ncbi:MAG: hypothetical protein HYT87_05200 [Nitrospirae bacterium]|nr:hypothetical protein [Nitrospirota bacterium]
MHAQKIGSRVLICFLAFFSGCLGRTPPDKLVLPPASDRWTKDVRVYDALDVNLEGYITYHSLDLRERAVARQTLDFHLGTQEVASRREKARKEWEQNADFYLSAFTPKRTWNDFDRRDSHWRIYLVGPDGARVEPAKIQKSSKDDAADLHPAEEWNRTYLIRFNRPSDKDKRPLTDDVLVRDYRLVVTGPLGEAVIKW